MTLPGFLGSVVSWLRAGYPAGVPETDTVPLLALLTRQLSSEEVAAVAQELVESGEFPIDNVDIAAVISKFTNELPQEEDVSRVRKRLAAHGWPLANDGHGQDPVSSLGIVGSIVAWLRAGYPAGVPEADYIPLLALLTRQLSSEEVAAVAQELVESGEFPIDNADIGTMITKVTDELPREEDVSRVRNRLAAHGWPLATV